MNLYRIKAHMNNYDIMRGCSHGSISEYLCCSNAHFHNET